MSKRWIWILVVVVLLVAFLVFGGGHALWVVLLRMHGVHA
jgi:membrane protein implicated in regulation of membrane protease activity